MMSIVFFNIGFFYLIYILFKSFKQKRTQYGFLIRGSSFLIISAGLMILFEFLSKIEAIRTISIFSYIFVYIYSWNPVTNAVGVGFLDGQIGFVIGIILFLSLLAFYELSYKVVKQAIKTKKDRVIINLFITLLLLGGLLGAGLNTFPGKLNLASMPDEERTFQIEGGTTFFGIFELEILRIHGIEKADHRSTGNDFELGPIVAKTTPDKIKRVNFVWNTITYAPERDRTAPTTRNKNILEIVPEALYILFLASQIWLFGGVFLAFYYSDKAKAILVKKSSLSRHLTKLILIAMVIATLLMSFPVTLRFEEAIHLEDYENFLETYEHFRAGSVAYMSYPEGGGRTSSSRAIKLGEGKDWENSIREYMEEKHPGKEFIQIYKIKIVDGKAPTIYSLYLWALPNMSAWTRGYSYLIMILMIFGSVRIFNKLMEGNK